VQVASGVSFFSNLPVALIERLCYYIPMGKTFLLPLLALALSFLTRVSLTLLIGILCSLVIILLTFGAFLLLLAPFT
jgi:hypothetical protein